MTEIIFFESNMLITNPKRKKQIDEFVDEDHEVMHEFYEITDSDISAKKLFGEMKILMKEDEDFYDSYLIVADIFFGKGENEKGGAILKEAYERAVKRIADSNGQWPKEMPWGFLENRHLMRAIERYGFLCWELGNMDDALDIFRRLLHSNPKDNQGVRYNILAMRLGLGPEEWQKPFEAKRKGEVVGLDAIKVDEWFIKNVPKFPDEFDWLLKLHAKWEKE